ncbi:hypothetical protein GCM10010383_78660 [Streptomyces lomondensis]|uniref:Uncharacterized protein n=1 Tax=Streptomyces lomondensis TaxID=68229 RepID=A0ABQ2XW08_9ACTN|nr:hypothetical protein GCM10010383_78660 [Streptomyces lomondensis]
MVSRLFGLAVEPETGGETVGRHEFLPERGSLSWVSTGRRSGTHRSGGNSFGRATPSTTDTTTRQRTLASWQRGSGRSREGTGYAVPQSCRPQTLAYALTDSPVGQLAWIVEEFQDGVRALFRPLREKG